MSFWRRLFVLGLSLSSAGVWSQVNVQKYRVGQLSFQFRSNNNSNTRCLFWFPLGPDDQPRIQYNTRGEPYVKARIRARLAGECPTQVSPPETIRGLPAGKDQADFKTFEVIVEPPVTTALVVGPNFKDELIFELPAEKLESIGFFNFFRKSKLYFETRYSQLQTTNPRFPSTQAKVAPIAGGSISVPVPWVPSFFMGYSMYQSLGNLVASNASKVQVSEFTFDLKYQWMGRESWGRPSVSPLVVDYRGRNLYQPGLSDSERPFVIGSFAMVGFGSEASWYFGALMAPWTSWVSRFGIDASTRFYLGGKIGGRKTNSTLFDGGLSYRISSKWALGAGYSLVTQKTQFPELAAGQVSEPIKSFFLRLQLVPRLEGANQ